MSKRSGRKDCQGKVVVIMDGSNLHPFVNRNYSVPLHCICTFNKCIVDVHTGKFYAWARYDLSPGAGLIYVRITRV